MNKRIKDITGIRFGRLIVLSFFGKVGTRVAWICQCDCGNKITVQANNIGRSTVSCGCIKSENAKSLPGFDRTTHGQYRSPTWITWVCMLTRCRNKNTNGYERYGGRGISVCERWAKFENFFEDMGTRPKGCVIDRIDNDGNYEPSNCRWSTYKESANNRSKRKC